MAEIRLILRLNVIMEANLIIRLVSDLIIRFIHQKQMCLFCYRGSVYVFLDCCVHNNL